MGGDGDLGAGGGVFLFGYGIDVGSGWVNTRPRCFEGTEKVENTVYIWYNTIIKYRRCFYD